MILVVDTSTLLDLESTSGVYLLPKLAKSVHVLDVVMSECGDELAEEIRAAGYREIAVSLDWVSLAMELKTAALSVADALVLYYARKNKAILIASDGPLGNKPSGKAWRSMEPYGWLSKRWLGG